MLLVTCCLLLAALLTQLNWIFQMLPSAQPKTQNDAPRNIVQFLAHKMPLKDRCWSTHITSLTQTELRQKTVCSKINIFFVRVDKRAGHKKVLPHALHDTFRLTLSIFHFLWFCCCCNRERARERERERCLSAYNLYSGIENMAVHTPLRITM